MEVYLRPEEGINVADADNLRYVTFDALISTILLFTLSYVNIICRLTMCANTTRTSRFAPRPLREHLRSLILRLLRLGMGSAFSSWASRDSLISCKYVSATDLHASLLFLRSSYPHSILNFIMWGRLFKCQLMAIVISILNRALVSTVATEVPGTA